MNTPENFRDVLNQELIERLEADPALGNELGIHLGPNLEEVAQIEQELPPEWSEIAYETELDQQIDDLARMDDQELNSKLEVPEGDIDQNARDAMQELHIDTQALTQE